MRIDLDAWRHKEANTAERLEAECGDPAYAIRRVSKHKWQVLCLKEGGPGGEPYYDYLYPATDACSTKREAVEWMRAAAERRDRDYTKMHPSIRGRYFYYDGKGRPTPTA